MTSAVEGPNDLDARMAAVDEVGDAFELRVAEAFDAFYRREMPPLVAFARSLSGSAAADDIAQDAMLAAYRHWDSVGRMDVPAAWVRRVCANRSVSAVRRRAVEVRGLRRLVLQREPAERLAEEHEAFWAAVRRLPRRQAQVVALQYVYDLGVAEIALTLGLAEGTVKSHLFRGRAALAATFDRTAEEDA
jgi:RNA polymerase sigma-70 factor (ECF subfamily)